MSGKIRWENGRLQYSDEEGVGGRKWRDYTMLKLYKDEGIPEMSKGFRAMQILIKRGYTY